MKIEIIIHATQLLAASWVDILGKINNAEVQFDDNFLNGPQSSMYSTYNSFEYHL